MSYWTGVPIALLFLAFALVSHKLSRSVLAGPVLFATVGFAIGPRVLGANPRTCGRQRR